MCNVEYNFVNFGFYIGTYIFLDLLVLSRQESGSSRGVPDPSASLDAIHPADRSSPHVSGNNHQHHHHIHIHLLSDVEHGATSGTATPTGSDSAANQVLIQTICGNRSLNQKAQDKGDLNPGEPASVLPRHPRNGAGPPGSQKNYS